MVWQKSNETGNTVHEPTVLLQVWTCYSCYAIVESVWSEVVFVRCVM